ncbi:50S ribosomal protein L9, partial [bacterium]|nr:50S ribosomal protein L9 [bacterium]
EIKNRANVEVDRKAISLDAPINKVGSFNMQIKLTSKVKVQLAVKVSASEVLKEEIEEVVEEKAAEEKAE